MNFFFCCKKFVDIKNCETRGEDKETDLNIKRIQVDLLPVAWNYVTELWRVGRKSICLQLEEVSFTRFSGGCFPNFKQDCNTSRSHHSPLSKSLV